MTLRKGIGAIVFAAALMGAASLPAQAVTIGVGAPGFVPTGPNVETFDSLSAGPNVSYFSSILGATITGGSFEVGSTSGVSAAPWMGAPDATTYMAAGPSPGTPITMLFSNEINGLNMYIGSIDSYNSLKFYDGLTLLATVSGSDLVAAAPGLMDSGCQNAFACNRDFSFGGMGNFDKVVLNSTQNALEFDNVSATPIPEPKYLFASALAMLGFIMWRRNKKQGADTFATPA